MCILNTARHTSQPAHKVGLPSALQRNAIQMAVCLRAGGGPLWIKFLPGITGCMLNGYVSRLKPQRGKRPFCIKANFLRRCSSSTSKIVLANVYLASQCMAYVLHDEHKR